MPRILCVGLATQDIVFSVDRLPDKPEKTRSRDMRTVGGGLAATAAVAAARLGAAVALASRLGDDWIGDHIVEELGVYGVDHALVRRYPGLRSAISAVLITPDGERLVVNFSDDTIPEDASWLPDGLDGIAAVHGDMRWEEGSKRMLLAARRAGIPAVLDVDRAPRDGSLIAAASHAAVSAQAARELVGAGEVAGAAVLLARRYGTWVAVTDGGRGTWMSNGGPVRHVPAFAVAVVDTLGAGDVFHGALTVALAEGRSEGEAVRFASAAAALKCTRFGGRAGAPTRAEVDTFLAARA